MRAAPQLRSSRVYGDSAVLFRVAVVACCLALAGCTLHARKQAATPPPPRTPVVQPKPQPEPPLSALQTDVDLPTPQVISPDAVPHTPEPSKPPENVQKAAIPSVTKPKKSPQPKGTTESPAEQESTDPPAAAPVPQPEDQPAVPEQGLFQTILTDGEKKRLQQNIEARDHEIDERLAKAAVKTPSDHDKGLLERITDFRHLSKEAALRGDLTQADALSDRALVLAKELQVE